MSISFTSNCRSHALSFCVFFCRKRRGVEIIYVKVIIFLNACSLIRDKRVSKILLASSFIHYCQDIHVIHVNDNKIKLMIIKPNILKKIAAVKKDRGIKKSG